MYNENSLQFCDAYILYYKFSNGLVYLKHLCRCYVIYHKWKEPGESFSLLTFRTCRFIF